MRDPERIDRIIEKLRGQWKRYPDVRLGQLLVGVTTLDMTLAEALETDFFYTEDTVVESSLDFLAAGHD